MGKDGQLGTIYEITSPTKVIPRIILRRWTHQDKTECPGIKKGKGRKGEVIG